MDSDSDDFLGESTTVRQLRKELSYAAQTSLPVLLLGEIGSGRQLAARIVHRLSSRRDKPFAAISLAALPPSLTASELVGHAKGSFTGADRDRPGLFERAHGGTILFVDIGAADLQCQSILLSVLGSVRRLGADTDPPVDVRVILTTNGDLSAMAAEGPFPVALFDRLAAIQVRIPPLRERREDIPALARFFVEKYGQHRSLTARAITALQKYDFPGNVRQLQNLMERAVFLSDKPVIDATDLPINEA
jgi:DNA-binding NtrC family response regulator